MLILKEIARKVVFLYNLQEVFQITVQNQKQENIHLVEKRVELYSAYLYLFYYYYYFYYLYFNYKNAEAFVKWNRS